MNVKKDSIKKYFKFLLFLAFIIGLSFVYFLVRNGLSDDFLVKTDLKIEKREDGRFDVEMKLLDSENNPASLVYVSIDEFESGRKIYEYSILRTNDKGKVSFLLEKGEYNLFVSTPYENDKDKKIMSMIKEREK